MEEGRARKHAASFSSDGEQSGVEKGEREEEVAKERYGDIERGGGIAINERVCGRESEREKRRPLIPLSPTPSKRPRTAAAQAPTHSTPPLHIRPQRRRSTAERERERERERKKERVCRTRQRAKRDLAAAGPYPWESSQASALFPAQSCAAQCTASSASAAARTAARENAMARGSAGETTDHSEESRCLQTAGGVGEYWTPAAAAVRLRA